ncbi:MAG: ATP-binding cassette domain-containing protein [Candidatus Velthaea sp.]
MPSGVELTRITKRFGSGAAAVTAVDDVSIAVEPGELIVLVGPSGCGKSTLLRIVAGLERQTSGTVAIGGRVVDELDPGKRDIAMVFQDYALYPHMDVYDNLAFGLRNRRVPRAEIDRAVREVARSMTIEDLLARRPRELSGGQRQRVAVGRALVRRPSVFLFDEPLSNLDAQLRARVRVDLAQLHRTLGATMIYVTHDQTEAMTLGDRIVVLAGGRVQQIGTPLALYARPVNTFVAGFLGTPPMNLIPQDGRTLGIRPEDVRICATGEPARLRGIVRTVEQLGAETIAYVEVAGALVAVRGPARSVLPVIGSAVELTADEHAVAAFDAATGERLPG